LGSIAPTTSCRISGTVEIIYSYKPLPYAEKAIYSKIADITISMKSTDHLQMPELISTQYEVAAFGYLSVTDMRI
jgi:hypothetical protein